MPDDPLSSTLAAIQEDIEATVAVYDLDGAGKNSFPVSAAMVRHARVLLAALEAVLKAHRPNTADGRCNWCRESDGQRSAFPCGEYLTIRAALPGEETADGTSSP